MTKQRRLFKKGFIPLFLVTFVCIFALVVTGANLLDQNSDRNDERMIQLADSPVRIMLKGNQSYRISLDGKNFSRELPQRNFIRLRNQVFDPLVNPPRAMTAQAPGERNLYIVQCVTQAIEPYQKQITAAGGEICGTLHDHALIVEMSGQTGREVRAMSFVRWVGVYQPSFKLLGLDNTVNRAMATKKTHYSLWLSKKNKKNDVEAFINSIGGEMVLKTKGRRMEAKLNANQLQKVAARPQVLAIDLWTPKEEDMNNAREIGGGNYLETVQGYTGQGVRAEVCDGGLRTTHVDFQANPPLINAGNSSSTSHGTPVFGIVFGDGTGNSDARGMIPDAEQPIFSCYNCFSDRYAHTQSVIALEGVFQTNSWGNSRTYNYTTISAEMDEIIFDLDILITQSQSNAGNQDSRPQAWAKNIVSVGGVRHYDTLSRSDDCWCTSASIGPAEDGRIKPDVWHFYDNTLAPYYTSDTSYTQFGGTSGATPITAGHVGLIFQMWADGVFEGGPGLNRDVFNSKPHFTTAKALLIHSAYQYPFSGTSHDKTRMHQGWGMPDVGNLYDMAEAANWSFPVLIDEDQVILPLETHTYNVNFDGTKPLRATLVYADPPGTPGVQPNRINDLSLKVTAPNGTTIYWGNNGLDVGVWSTSGGSSNTIDTVENVFIETPAVGTWTIQVLADEVVQDGHVETGPIDADYALVVSGGDSGPNPPPAAPTALSATAGEVFVDLDWADNTEPDLASYNVKRSTTTGGPYTQIANVTASAYTDNGVTAGTTYYYVVTAVDSASNESDNSTESSATPFVDPPAAPTSLTATAGTGQVDLDWADNTEPDLASYNVKRATTTGGPYTQIANVTASAYTDTTVTDGTTYYYVVTAVDTSSNESGNSNEASATPTNPPPAAPTSLTATAGNAQVDLDWADNTEPDLASYNVKRATTSGGPYTQVANVTVSSWTDTTVTNGTTYYYVVTAVDTGSNESGNSNEASATPTDEPPAAPTGLTAAAGNGQVDLDWADNTEPDLASYNVKRATSTGGPYTQIANVTASNYTDTTVTNGTTYYYVVTAVDSGSNESGNSNEASATPTDPPPAAPTGLTATAGNGQVDLDWADNTEPDLASYNVKRSTTSGGPYTQIANVTVSNYTDTTVTNDTTYYYVVTAVDTGSNESGNSNEASATPTQSNPPDAPTNLQTNPSEEYIDLTWNDNSDNEDGFKIYRGTSSSNLTLYATVGPNSTSYRDSNIQEEQTYYYKVCAYNDSGETCSNIAQASGGD